MKQLLLTGATGGLGSAIIADALSRGWKVTGLHGANSSKAAALRSQHAAAGAHLDLLGVELQDQQKLAEIAQSLSSKAPWNAFIHLAAAPLEISPFTRQTPAHFEAQWRTMVLPAVILTQCILPGMRQRKHGSLIYCLSAVTLGDVPKGMSSYTSAKYALLGLARTVAAECAGTGICVTSVSPGPMDTELLRHLPALARDQLRTHGKNGEFLKTSDAATSILDVVEKSDPALHGANVAI